MLDITDGRAVAKASAPQPFERPQYYYTKQTAKDMKTRFLKSRLCEAGPALCLECGLCEYGKEYVKRRQHHENQRDAPGNTAH